MAAVSFVASVLDALLATGAGVVTGAGGGDARVTGAEAGAGVGAAAGAFDAGAVAVGDAVLSVGKAGAGMLAVGVGGAGLNSTGAVWANAGAVDKARTAAIAVVAGRMRMGLCSMQDQLHGSHFRPMSSDKPFTGIDEPNAFI